MTLGIVYNIYKYKKKKKNIHSLGSTTLLPCSSLRNKKTKENYNHYKNYKDFIKSLLNVL